MYPEFLQQAKMDAAETAIRTLNFALETETDQAALTKPLWITGKKAAPCETSMSAKSAA